jgi:hypothetical protein
LEIAGFVREFIKNIHRAKARSPLGPGEGDKALDLLVG